MPDDLIPELQDLLGASTFSQLAREAAAPAISFDENELTVQTFESSSPINISQGAETASRLEIPAAATSENVSKISSVTSEMRSLEKLSLANGSRHQAYVRGMVDSMRHRPVFKTIRNSEIWAALVQSCTNFVEAQVAEAAR